MREIKFRGLNIDGTEWRYGLLSISQGRFNQPESGHFISNSAGEPWAYLVRPETLGQFTGVYDVSEFGRPIYEGDIVEGNPIGSTGNITGDVRWWRGGWRVFSKHTIDKPLCYGFFGGMRVLGNIYQNQELLT